MLTKRNKVERMTIVNTLLTSIYEELLKDEVDDIDGLLQIAVYAQVEMNRIVFDLNQRNGCEPTADTPQTDCEDTSCPYFKNPDYSRCMKCKSQTESTGSPIGDYRDGVGAWQTDCPWK